MPTAPPPGAPPAGQTEPRLTDEDRAWDFVYALHWRGTNEVLDWAVRLCRSSCAVERRVGADILGQLGVPERTFPEVCLRTLLGMLLGWIVWRTGSIYPAMLAHGLYDTSSLAMAAWQIHHSGLSSIGTFTPLDYWALAIGAVLILVSVVMWVRLSPSMPRDALRTFNARPLTPAAQSASAT